MIGLFESRDRRVKDKREIRYFYAKYGAEAPDVLSARANDPSLADRDRRHWSRLARKARRGKSGWMNDADGG